MPLAGIAELPTPLERLDLSDATAGLVDLWVKRDDRTSALYGGNKVRKLDYLLGQALAEKYSTVLTFGAYGSNHALATAVHARRLGLEPHVVLSPQEPGPFAPSTLLAHAGLGTVIHLVDGWDGRREAVLAGTLGTAVGLALGFAAAGASTRVEAIRVTPLEICSEQIAERLAIETSELLAAADAGFPRVGGAELALTLRHEFFDPGYGVVTPETTEAVAVGAAAGLHLETTYSGKAFSAMLSDARSGRLQGERVLFWDTYNSAPYPEPGDVGDLPEVLRSYIEECRRRFPAA